MEISLTPSNSSSQYSASPPYYAANQPPITPNPPRQTRADQIVQNFYTKVTQVVTHARLIQYDSQISGRGPQNANIVLPSRQPIHPRRPNKWFNLELWDSDVYKDGLKSWRQASQVSTGTVLLPMIIEFFLDVSDLNQNQILFVTDEILRRQKVDLHKMGGSNENNKSSKNIVLESWQLTLSHPLPDPLPELPVVYKKSIAFFRTLYAYVRLLPAYRLYRRIRKKKLSSALKIGYRFVLPTSRFHDDIGIDVPIIEGESRPTSADYKFNSIDTPLGVLSLKVNYRTNCEFHVDDSSEVLIDMDENYFTPTLANYYQPEEQGQREEQRQQEKSERRKSVPTSLKTPPPGFPHPGSSPKHTNNQLNVDIPPIRTLSPSRSNPEMKEHNSSLTFPKFYNPSSSTNLGSNFSRRGSHTLEPIMQREYSSFYSPTGPNVTLVKPFKSPSLSSSPVNHDMMPPSPTLLDRMSTLHLHRSPSQLSFQQRGTPTMSSSVKSTSSAGSLPKFSSSFTSFTNRFDKTTGSTTRERDGSFSSRRRSTNRSDGSTSDRGSLNSSFFTLDPEDDVGEFVRMCERREPLKMFSKSPTDSDDADGTTRNLSGSVYRTQLQLSRFQKLKETHKNLSESMMTGTGDVITGSPSSGISLRVHQPKVDDDDMFFTMSEFSDDKTTSAVNNVSGPTPGSSDLLVDQPAVVDNSTNNVTDVTIVVNDANQNG
ncbi:autophagy-related protein 13-domain-containing protein [Gigaspora margarita]|uniref:Autophagy-related protein 13 n=1 Tax=Gigaspora margarita TaxID=4874 RepID=A0A8H4EH51_GIGMA|nr:autophagy-related protein 13-domain-containing protein [Gigaspora margarita]